MRQNFKLCLTAVALFSSPVFAGEGQPVSLADIDFSSMSDIYADEPARCDGVSMAIWVVGQDHSSGVTILSTPDGKNYFERYQEGALLSYGFYHTDINRPSYEVSVGEDFLEITDVLVIRDVFLEDRGYAPWGADESAELVSSCTS